MKILKCGCGYLAPADRFDYSYHNNNGCGNEYVEITFVEKVYIIFTRHPLTSEQWDEIKYDADQFGGLEECEIVNLTDLASLNISSVEEAEEIFEKILKTLKTWEDRTNHIEIYGVIPVPIRFLMFSQAESSSSAIVNEAFNINRSPEGEKPNFVHYCWLPTGKIFY